MSAKKAISGPYRATKLWNDAVRSFYNGMPVSKHWRGLRQYERCFTAAEAIDWLHNHLQSDPNFGSSVSRDQTTKLLRKFLKSGLIEDVRGNSVRPEDFKDSRELYRFSNRSPLKALRTPRTPGRVALAAINPNTPSAKKEADEGASPVLRKRHQGSARESMRRAQTQTEAGRQRGGSIRNKILAKKSGSQHSGENAANEVKDSGGMQECHLVAKQLSKAEVNDVWKHVLLGKLDTICERLMFGDTFSVLDPKIMSGDWVHHNMTQVTTRGVVQAPESHPEDLPNWILTAMKCMAHWPNAADSSCNIPNYPGVEKDVFKIVRDFFTNMLVPLIPYELYEPLARIYIGAEFLDITYRSPNSTGGVSSFKSHDGSYDPGSFEESDSVEDLMLNMSICGQQKTSTPNTDNENNQNGERQAIGSGGKHFIRQGSSRSLGSGLHTPSLRRSSVMNSSRLQSLKLNRLKHYTDFKEDNLYPTLLEGSHEESRLDPQENQENTRPNSRQSRLSQENSLQKQPETVRSVKTNDQARRIRRENDMKEGIYESRALIRSRDINSVALPENYCFETAFTSDSPQTRIIPQKSVDTIHFKNGERINGFLGKRPKSIAVTSLSAIDVRPPELKNMSTVSDLFKSSIMSTNTTGEYVTASAQSPMNRSRSAGNLECLGEDSCVFKATEAMFEQPQSIVPARSLASRIRDSIKRKHVRDDSVSRKKKNRSRDSKDTSKDDSGDYQRLDRLRTKSGGYMNLALAPVPNPQEDSRSVKSCVSDYQELGSVVSHIRTKSGGFLNLALEPSSDSVNRVETSDTFSGPPTSRSESSVQDHHSRSVSPLYGRLSQGDDQLTAPCTDFIRRRVITPDGCLSHSLSSSGCSVYHSALSSRNSTPNPGPPLPPKPLQPVSGMGGIYPKVNPKGTAPNYENVSDLSKQLSSSANELSDRWADRTPYGQVPPYAQGGVWRHYHSSPSKRLIGRKKGIENYYGSKACLPGLLTREGKEVAVSSIQLLLLLLEPVRRRKLHLLLRMMSKMSGNEKLCLDQEQTTRALVLNTFTRSILLCDQEADYDEVLSLRIISFLMDNHEEVLRPPQDLAVLVHRRLSEIQRSQITNKEFERQRMTGSQLFLAQLLDQIVENDKLSSKEKKKKLKEFKSLYPEVYAARFPGEEQKVESRSKMKSLMKLASLSSLGKGRSLRM